MKKLCNMGVMVIPVGVGVLGTVHKELERSLEELGIRERIESIQTRELLISTRKLRVREIWEDLLSLRFPWKTTS